MAIAASGFPAAASLSQAAPSAAGSSAPATQATTPAPLARQGFILAYNPNAPFANLQDLVAVPNADPKAALTGALQTSNGGVANPVVYRIASHLYRSLLNQ
jgi:tripartite-type tricarboxylate transporter receptor subunit TctC